MTIKLTEWLVKEFMMVGDQEQSMTNGPDMTHLGMGADHLFTSYTRHNPVREKMLQGNEEGSVNRDESMEDELTLNPEEREQKRAHHQENTLE
jgi:hypothetical protein